MKNYDEAIAVLEQLADPNHQPDGTRSICKYVVPTLAPAKPLFELFEEWSEFSGNYSYPVPSQSTLEPREQFEYCRTYGRMWLGEYGAARRRLAAFLAKRLRELFA